MSKICMLADILYRTLRKPSVSFLFMLLKSNNKRKSELTLSQATELNNKYMKCVISEKNFKLINNDEIDEAVHNVPTNIIYQLSNELK